MFFRHLLYLLTGLLAGLPGHAQTPHITGDVYISVKDGLFRADLDVSRLPRTRNYTIWLNSGFNVRDFRDSTGTALYGADRLYEGEKAYESFQYWFPSDDNKTRFLPRRFKISYTGAFPMYSDTARRRERGDWKGNIAFNGKTLRASEQTAWYPVLYDTLEDRTYTNVTYDITVHAADARAIYLNGSAPQYGQQARFRSDVAYPLMLFVGDFDFRRDNGTFLVNTGLTVSQASVLDGWLGRIKQYYAKKLGVPYGSSVTLLASTPVSRRNDWLFVTYPTIAAINPKGSLSNWVNDKTHTIADSSDLSFLSHELGHYYFGTVMPANSTLRWVFLEGLTEYISLQAMRDLVGQPAYDKQIKRYAANSEKMKSVVPLNQVRKPDQIDNTYRYEYFPLLITALERQIGRDAIWRWLHYLLTVPTPATDYAFFRKSLLDSGVDAKTFGTFETNYLTSEDGTKALVALFKKPATAYYYWSMSREVLKPGVTRKPQLVYTPIGQMAPDQDQLDRTAKQFHDAIKKRCATDTEMCTSDFNYYETQPEAEQTRARWLKRYADTYEAKEVPLSQL